jgi:HSP20 family protein
MAIILRNSMTPSVGPWGLFDEFDSLFDGFFGTRVSGTEHTIMPLTDVYEEKDQLVVKTELPGIDSKEIDVNLEGDTLTIKAEKKEEVKEDATRHTRERYYGHYLRSMTLPYPVKEGEIKATFDNGVLELTLPKAEEAKPRKIEIKAQLPEGKTKKPHKTT